MVQPYVTDVPYVKLQFFPKMKTTVQGIVLRSPVRHSDRADILTVYTPDRGRLSVVILAGGGKSVRHRHSLTMPLSHIEFQTLLNASGALSRASALSARVTYHSIYFHPLKSAIAMLMAEFLNRLLRDTAPDPLMYRYIADSVRLLDDIDDDRRLANFHLAFLAGAASFAGIAPDTSGYFPGAIFDMVAGRYTSLPPAHRNTLTADEARIPLLLSRMNFANQHLYRFSRLQRNRILDGILRYFGLHFPGTDNLNSPAVLATLFQ